MPHGRVCLTSVMELDDIKRETARLSPWAHMATVGSDGEPDVVPVHPAWDGDTLWIMTGAKSVKCRNVADHNGVALHWQVTESGDGVEVWGEAEVHTDLETKERLWNGVFDYDLNQFAPDGPSSPDIAMVAVRPTRALYLIAYGMGGRDTWSAS